MGELIRHFRNFIIISLLIVIIFGLCFSVSAVLVTVAISDPKNIKFTGDILVDGQHYFTHFCHWWKQWWLHRASIKLAYKQYFVVKLFALTIMPFLVFITLGWTLRAPLMDWRPFKKKESVHGDAKQACAPKKACCWAAMCAANYL